MYIRASHQPRDPADVVEVIREHMFATLVTGMVASHLPFVLEGETLYAHMARANPQSRMLDGEALVIFQGPHGYISPSWYEDRATAPTWDYVAVHCYGRPRVHDGDETRRNIERLIARVEAGRPNPWSLDDLSEDEIAELLRNVVSFEIPIERTEGKFKLNQGDTEEHLRAAIAALEREGSGALAAYLRRFNGL
ncbi:MAG TPA: FMN-binding negative transcriptional regulator [Thermoanaerobaculia bacterium]|nr:FMN-binding negative transcriptional regulator [Thermoanaerobaculia bacterium]